MIAKQTCRSIGYREKGFTLLETLLVIAILGIIALIVVPNFVSLSGSGETEVCDIEERLVRTATMAYVVIEGACPTTIDDLVSYIGDLDDILGSYSFAGTYPNCTATQDSCP